MRRSKTLLAAALATASLAALLAACGDDEPPATGASPDGGDDATLQADASTAPEDAPSSGDDADAGTDASRCDDKGLLAAYAFDEAAGALVRDCGPLRMDGTLEEADASATRGTRNGGGALEVAPGEGFVAIGPRPELELTGAFSVAAFVRSDVAPGAAVGVVWHRPDLGWELALDAGGALHVTLGLAPDESLDATFPPLTPGAWTHVAFVYEPGFRLELFVDGASVTRITTVDGGPLPPANVAPPTEPTGLRFGHLPATPSTWRGGIDEVRIYSRWLNDSEIASLAAR
ncbi:MAG: LamG domain-containing protein [Labilithrix sp.]|nr:LamG domain-containing protein [Labilithrix sp.]